MILPRATGAGEGDREAVEGARRRAPPINLFPQRKRSRSGVRGKMAEGQKGGRALQGAKGHG